MTEMQKLHAMLDDAGIESDYRTKRSISSAAGQLEVEDDDGLRVVSGIDDGYGSEDGLLEIMGLLTPEEEGWDEVRGWLTAEDVFSRIKEWHAKSKKGEQQ